MGVGSGNSSVKHAKEVGELFHSSVFKWPLGSKQVEHNALCISRFTVIQNLVNSLAVELSPTSHTNESLVHNSAKKAGITLDCNLQHLDLPVCAGYDDDGSPLLAIQPWPFLLPSDLVP